MKGIPVWVSWIKYVSIIYWSWNLLLKIEFSNRSYPCSQIIADNPFLFGVRGVCRPGGPGRGARGGARQGGRAGGGPGRGFMACCRVGDSSARQASSRGRRGLTR